MTTAIAAENAATAAFRAARDFLLDTPDPVQAHAQFEWPKLEYFNWATDWFDVIAAGNSKPALWICSEQGDTSFTFEQLLRRSTQVTAWLQGLGIQSGERMLILLRNSVQLYEVLLAAIRLGVVVVPAHVSIRQEDLNDRIKRGGINHLLADHRVWATMDNLAPLQKKIAVGAEVPGCLSYADSYQAPEHCQPIAHSRADDALFGYFTSGTTSLPKLALHTHVSYPVGHLSGMYWNGVRPDDVHLNVSNPGWAKHAWSSFFVPWNAQACIVVLDVDEPTPQFILDVMHRRSVSTFCAPTTIWRKLHAAGMGEKPANLHQATSAGEPLQEDLFVAVNSVWGIPIRDGYGQTEATALIGNAPGAPIKQGSMGRPLPGYDVVLLDQQTNMPGDEGEVCLDLRGRRPMGLMLGYDANTTSKGDAVSGQFYRTGDFAKRDSDGYITFIGRLDDVFKSFDYRISPFEIERVLREHPAILEIAVVASPDPVGLAVPKAFVILNPGYGDVHALKADLTGWIQERFLKEHFIKRIGFVSELPKTTSGKIQRAKLRAQEALRDSVLVEIRSEQETEIFLFEN